MPPAGGKRRKEKEKRPVLGHVTVPYVQGVSEPLTRVLREHDLVVHSRPHTKLRNLLVAPKDPTPPLDKSGVVYKVQCKECPSVYVGETGRPLRSRISEHQRDSSPVGHYAKFNKHNVDLEEVEILDHEHGWLQRGIREAIQIEAKDCNLTKTVDATPSPHLQGPHSFLRYGLLPYNASRMTSHLPTHAQCLHKG